MGSAREPSDVVAVSARVAIAVVAVLAGRADADDDPPIEPAPDPQPEPPQEPTRTYEPLTPPKPPPPPEPAKPALTEQDAPPKLSLPTEADRQAWDRPGFRLTLGMAYGELHGIHGAPSGRLLGPVLRFGLRLDADWSLIASFMYASASRAGGLASGFRFAGTLDPTWHVTRRFSVAAGFGFGGIVEGGARMEHVPDGLGVDQLDTSYTFPDAKTPIASCSGAGAAGLVRAEYGYVIGPRSRFSVTAEAIAQWTLCTDDSGRFEPDTGNPIERRQYWAHAGGNLTLGITWR